MILRHVFGLVVAAVLAPVAHADQHYWLSVPGLCNASEGEIELADAIYLTEFGIDSHYFSCTWSESASLMIRRGAPLVETEARCENATDTWIAKFEIVGQQDGSVRVFQDGGGISPVPFYRCD